MVIYPVLRGVGLSSEQKAGQKMKREERELQILEVQLLNNITDNQECID